MLGLGLLCILRLEMGKTSIGNNVKGLMTNLEGEWEFCSYLSIPLLSDGRDIYTRVSCTSFPKMYSLGVLKEEARVGSQIFIASFPFHIMHTIVIL